MDIDTRAHLTTVRGLLEFERDELRSDVRAMQIARTALLESVALQEVDDREAAAASEQLSDLSNVTQERLLAELAECEGALQRLDEGRYGVCADCSESIPWPRLLARPATERCAACQRAFERHGAVRRASQKRARRH